MSVFARSAVSVDDMHPRVIERLFVTWPDGNAQAGKTIASAKGDASSVSQKKRCGEAMCGALVGLALKPKFVAAAGNVIATSMPTE